MNSDESPTPDQELAVQTSNSSQALSEELSFGGEDSEPKGLFTTDSLTPDKIESKEAECIAQKSDKADTATEPGAYVVEQLSGRVAELQRQKDTLEAEIEALTQSKTQITDTLGRIVAAGLEELEGRKQALQIEIEQLELRRERIREEMRTSFAGISQELAIRVQGFKDYLVGSLQDLAAAAEQLELPTVQGWSGAPETEPEPCQKALQPQFVEPGFQEQARRIRRILDQYRTHPDYYGPPWQLRRTFEPIHAERVEGWFFSQGGRGAIPTMGSRLQNILLASSVISILHSLEGDIMAGSRRRPTLVLANTPERLGEWRRGLQDCLGISRSDFGPERGIVLFEADDALVQKAERLLADSRLPLVVIDETEDRVSLSLLQFPLWLAFASDPQQTSSYMF